MNVKKVSLSIVTISLIGAGMVFNLRITTQSSNSHVLLSNLEALTIESSAAYRRIILHGSLVFIPVKSYTSPSPFEVYEYSSYITVSYLINLNNITVKIVNAAGQAVYSNNVNPVAGGQLYISLAGLSSGDYTLVFLAPNGNSIYGDFEI